MLKDEKVWEGLSNWSRAQAICRAAGDDVSSGTVSVEAMWSFFLDVLYDRATTKVHLDTFDLLTQVHFLRYNTRHARSLAEAPLLGSSDFQLERFLTSAVAFCRAAPGDAGDDSRGLEEAWRTECARKPGPS